MNGLIPPRSRSVIIAAVLAIVTGVYWLAMSAVMLWVARGQGGDYSRPGHKELATVALVLCASIGTVIGGFAILLRRNWGRILAIALAGPWIFFGYQFLEPFFSLPVSLHPDASMIVPFAFPLVAALAWLALLARTKVRTEFLPPATVQIYVNLMGRDAPCSRRAQALAWGNGLFELLPCGDCDPSGEHWEFLPGSFVHCTTVERDGKTHLLAVSVDS